MSKNSRPCSSSLSLPPRHTQKVPSDGFDPRGLHQNKLLIVKVSPFKLVDKIPALKCEQNKLLFCIVMKLIYSTVR